MALSAEDIAKLEEKLKAIERLSERLGENINTINLRPVEQNAGAINELFRSLNEKLEDVGTNTNYLATSFKEIISEIKNSNAGVSELSRNLKGLSSISEQLSQYQKGYTNLSSQQIAQFQEKTRIETNRLKITQSILQAEGIELERKTRSAGFTSLTLTQQNKILKDLQQNEAAQKSINDLLSNQNIILAELNNELDSSFNKAKKIEEIYGLSGVAVEGVSKALNKLGFGGLASQLGIDEAKSKMQALSNDIVSNLAKEEKTRERLKILNEESTYIAQQLNNLGTKAVDTTNKLVDITEKLNQLKAKGDESNKDELTYYEKYKKELEEQLELERKSIDNFQSKDKAIKDNIKAESEELKQLEVFNATYSGINGKLAVMKAGFSSMKDSIIKNLKDPLVVTGFLIDQIVGAFKSSDKATGDLAKSFNITYGEAVNVRNELIEIGNLSGDVTLNARALQETLIAVGQSLGSNAMLNKEDLKTFTELREKANLTNDELIGLEKTTLATGGNLKDNVKNLQFAAKVTGINNKVLLNEKDIMRDVAKASNSIKLSLAGNPEALGKAAAQAKALGMSLDQVDNIAESLLNFEQSISSELEAELLTGKDLNLEQARLYALNNDMEGLSREIAKNFGSAAEFSKMNRLQQEAAAKAVGMNREELARTLIDKEALSKMSAKDPELAKKTLEFARQKGMTDEEISKLKEKDFENLTKQQSVQERFNNTIEKLKEVFISLIEPLLPVLDTFMLLIKPISIIAGVLGQILGFIGKIVSSGPGMAVLFTTLGLVLLPKILLGIGSMGRGIMDGAKAMKSMVTSSIDLVKNLAKGNITGAFSPKSGEKFGALREKVEAKKLTGKKTLETPDTSKVGEGGEKISKKGLTAGFKDNMTNIAEGFKAMGQEGVGKGIFNTMAAGPALVIALPSIPFLLFMGRVKLNNLISNFESLALGLDAMGQGGVLKGIGNTLLAGPAMASATLGLPFLLIFGKVKLPQLIPNFKSLALGLQAMAPTFVGSAALAAFGLASIVALPSLLFLGGIALLGEAGSAGLIALGAGLESLGLVAATGLPFIAVGLIASLGAAMIPFAYALNIATPAIEAFGDGISGIFTTLGNIDASRLLLIGPALFSIGAGLAALGGGGILGAVGGAISKLFGGGGPIETLTELSKLGEPLNLVATSIQNVASSLTQLSASLAQIDVSKLEAIKETTNKSLIGSVFGGIKEIVTAPIKAVGELISLTSPTSKSPTVISNAGTSTVENNKITESNKIVSTKNETSTSINLPELKQMIDELKAIKNELTKSNKNPTVIENSINGTRFGTAVAMNTFKTQ